MKNASLKGKKKASKKKTTKAPVKKKPIKVTEPVKQPVGFHWGIALLLGFIIGASLLLRTNEVIIPKPAAIVTHPLDDDTAVRLKAIEASYPKLAKPPRVSWSDLPVTVMSIRHILLIDSDTTKQQLTYFEASAAAITASNELPKPKEIPVVAPVAPALVGVNVPILMYHRTPSDFEKQINHLVTHGYTTVGFSELVAAIKNKAPLPAKPVIITLDDGYADQMNEINILRKYNMKATLYVINGGEASKWCIGANAKGLPGCETYLNWDQIRELDRGGLITIGSHTLNHANLASLNAEQQRAEILGGKQQLEIQLGHAVYDFAYPYGAFNSTSVQIAQQVGFREAVSTISGTAHTMSTLFSLHRVRDSLELP